MNRKSFIEKLSYETGYSEDKCKMINEVIESRIMIGKNNKQKTIDMFAIKLGIDETEASNIYDICIKILGNEFKNKIKHPFKSKK